jgi:putative photosynthetic complex assembly protein 2
VFEIAIPLLFAVLLWWASTGAILYLDGLGRRTFSRSMGWMSGLTVLALLALWLTREEVSATGAYVAFTAALVVWGWNEMAFLMGYLTGPRREPCPPDATGLRRFWMAAGTLIHHELAILASAAVIWAVTAGATNQFGLATFMVLWVMRLSTKLNIFLGAPNVPVEFLPAHLGYLKSYFRKRPMNGFFPIAVTAATLATARLAHLAYAPEATALQSTGFMLLTTLMALAVLEHWLLYVPFKASTLWGWGLTSHQRVTLRRTGKPMAAGVAADDLITWSFEFNRTFRKHELDRLLIAINGGQYGDVVTLDGVARSVDGWLRFIIANGEARMDPVGPLDARAARVTAVGRHVDRARLTAAFEACVA